MRTKMYPIFISVVMLFSTTTWADKYVIDSQGMHAFIQFRVKHLGFSWLYGRFNDFKGSFTYHPDNPQSNQIEVEINTRSLDTNHAQRDRHLRSSDFLNTAKFGIATFQSTQYTPINENTATLIGDLTLRGVTKEVTVNLEHIGGGEDPWGGFRQGFEGNTTIKPGDFGINMVGQLGPTAEIVELVLSIEGVKQE